MIHKTPTPPTNQPLNSQTIFAALRDALANLYREEANARRIVDDAGLDAIQINFNATARINWHHILAEAIRQNQLEALLEIVLEDYSENQRFYTAYTNYRHFIDKEGHLHAPPYTSSLNETSLVTAKARLANLPVDHLPPVSSLPNEWWRMKFNSNSLFVGRESELMSLAQLFKQRAHTAIIPVVNITGIGGIGKTQLAVEFVHRYGQFFQGGVFWLNFADPDGVHSEIAECGNSLRDELPKDYATLDIKEQVRQVKLRWQHPLPRLLIFDNCESEQLLQDNLPASGGCHVLLTSRYADWSPHLDVQVLPLKGLSRHDSIALLCKPNPHLLSTNSVFNDIAEELGDLPLALHLAAYHLRQYRNRVTPAKYLEELRQPDLLKHRSLQGIDTKTSPTHHEMHVARTFQLSYNQLNGDDATDLLALEFLARIAQFAPNEPIPYWLLTATVAVDDYQATDALDSLVNSGLIEYADNTTKEFIVIHPLIAAFVHTETELITLEVKEGVAIMIKAILDNPNEFSQFNLPISLYPLQRHIRHITHNAFERYMQKENFEEAANIHHLTSPYLSKWGDTSSKRKEQLIRLNVEEFDDPNENIVILFQLGSVYREEQNYHEALQCYDEILKSWGKEPSYRGPVFVHKGHCYAGLGQLSEARTHYQQAISLADEPNDILLEVKVALKVKSLFGLGLCATKEGKIDTAINYYQQVLAIVGRNEYSDDQDMLSRVLNNLGYSYNEIGEIDLAIKSFNDALGIAQEIGDKLTEVDCLNNIGYGYTNSGEYDKAHEYLQQGLKITQELSLERQAARIHESFAQLLTDENHYVPAQSYALATLELATKQTQGISTSAANLILAQIYLYLGNWSEARKAAEVAYAQNENRYAYLASTMLGLVKLREGFPEEATNLLQTSLTEIELIVKDNPKNYQAYFTKGLATAALIVCHGSSDVAPVKAAYQQALTITQAKGIVKRNLALLREATKVDKNQVLAEIEALLEKFLL